ncbi:hypothetical protein E8E12_010394 [Didymella heteroderae]|uniref:Uncharacterized protein n=1 Tax=Didymella heteroderae TaxID=1769908 RepID=A0A9P5C547_9PLEO|nr:hypothetical protein E8E12_010394 [Didymella heteroderae]
MSQSRYPQYNWRQSKHNHWEREVDEAECFYASLAKSYEGSGRMFFAITGFVSISVDLTNGSIGQDVEDALLDYDKERGKYFKTYNSFDPAHLDFHTESWLSDTFISITPNMHGLDWCNSDPLAPRVPTLFVITPPYSNDSRKGTVNLDLVFRSPHDIIDGIGTLQLLNKLLVTAARYHADPSSFELPLPGSECQNLSPPLRVAALIPPILTLDQQERLQNTISSNAALRQDAELLSVPFTQGEKVPGKHQRAALGLSIGDTNLALQACKALGTTVTHAYHASIALLLRDLRPSRTEARAARYINYCLVNERPNCAAPYSTPDHAAAVYHSVSGTSLALDLTIPSGADRFKDHPSDAKEAQKEFRTLVDQVRDFYTSIRNSPENLALAPSFWSMATPHIANPTSKWSLNTPVPAPNQSPSVSLSSMGKLDNVIAPQHGAFSTKNPWVTGEELGTGIGVFLGTWQGQLQLSAAYNEAWHDREEVRGFLERCCGIVWKGLGLGDGTNHVPKVEWVH